MSICARQRIPCPFGSNYTMHTTRSDRRCRPLPPPPPLAAECYGLFYCVLVWAYGVSQCDDVQLLPLLLRLRLDGFGVPSVWGGARVNILPLMRARTRDRDFAPIYIQYTHCARPQQAPLRRPPVRRQLHRAGIPKLNTNAQSDMRCFCVHAPSDLRLELMGQLRKVDDILRCPRANTHRHRHTYAQQSVQFHTGPTTSEAMRIPVRMWDAFRFGMQTIRSTDYA